MFTGAGHDDADHISEIANRWEYSRPNLITLSNNQGRYFVDGDLKVWLPEGSEGTDFVFLSDHNRSSAPFETDRIGTRKRMIDGKMRAYHIADKLSLNLSWDDIPSRAYSSLGGYADWAANPNACAKFTVDGGAGGLEMLKWYDAHKGSMWAFFSFDNVYTPVASDTVFRGYGRVYEVMITDFSYDVSRRSGGYRVGMDTYSIDLWNVSMSLEEV